MLEHGEVAVHAQLEIFFQIAQYAGAGAFGTSACQGGGVICIPEVFEYENELLNYEAIVLACDGLYDVLSNKEAMLVVLTMKGIIYDGDMTEREI